MSLTSLLTQDVQILPFEEGAVNEYNDPTPSFGDPVDVKAYVEKRGGDEELEDRETAVSRWLLVLGPGALLDHRDRIVYDGQVFQVDGTVDEVWNPRTASVHHIEADLTLVEDLVESGS